MQRLSKPPAALPIGVLLFLCAAAAGAQAAYRVKDIDTASQPALDFFSGSGGLDATLLFGASSANNPQQLWRSDGTREGTELVKSLHADGFGPPFGGPVDFVRVGGDIFFVTDLDELWKSDGTSAGTILVKSFAPPANALESPRELVEVNGVLYFVASDGIQGDELWRSDGTAEGTVLVADLVPLAGGSDPSSLTRVGNSLYFFAADLDGVWLWKTDGTAAGTVHVTAIDAGRSPSSLTAVDSGLLFFLTQQTDDDDVVTYSLWRTDGTGSGIAQIRDFAADYPDQCTGDCLPIGPSELTPLSSNSIVLIANDGVRGRQLWTSDGTAVGTVVIIPSPSFVIDGDFARLDDVVYFRASESVHGSELWGTDGTFAGTQIVKDTIPGPGDGSPYGMTAFDGHLYFGAGGGNNAGALWISDGTESGSHRVKDVGVLAFGNGHFTPAGDELFFRGQSPNAGGLWKTDGTEQATVLVSDFATSAGSYPYYLTDVGGRLFFSTRAGEVFQGPYQDLWTSDGTAAGTVTIASFSTFAASTIDFPTTLAVMGGRVFFSADDGNHGVELWSSNGTTVGTVLVRDIAQPPGSPDSEPSGLTAVGSTLFFAAFQTGQGFELWKSNGSASGTLQVKNIRPGLAGSTIGNAYTAAGNLLFFLADDGDHGTELWRSDGTVGGTFMLKDINPGPDYPVIYQLVVRGDSVFFIATDGIGYGLWTSDGSVAGTHRLTPIPGTPAGYTLTGSGPLFYFTDTDVTQLWRSDGTETGTFVIQTSAFVTSLTDVDGRLFFVADDGVHGQELWTTDGLAEGTVLVEDINPGATGSVPAALASVDGRLLFAADDGVHGKELWRSDGTARGTAMVQDLAPGSYSSTPSGFTKSGDRVFFIADDGVSGTELWAVPASALTEDQGRVEPVAGGPRETRTIPPRD